MLKSRNLAAFVAAFGIALAANAATLDANTTTEAQPAVVNATATETAAQPVEKKKEVVKKKAKKVKKAKKAKKENKEVAKDVVADASTATGAAGAAGTGQVTQ